jgi:hypothetical protein
LRNQRRVCLTPEDSVGRHSAFLVFTVPGWRKCGNAIVKIIQLLTGTEQHVKNPLSREESSELTREVAFA